MVHEIVVPQLGVNDEFVTVAEWHLNDRDKIQRGGLLCVIETGKATTDLIAENEGFLRITKKAGEEAKIKEAIGYIVDSLDEKVPVKNLEISKGSPVKATNKAKELALSLGIDIETIDKTGIIREKDIRKFYESKKRLV